MSLHNFGQAHYYALSLQHELRALTAIIEEAGEHLVASLQCESAPVHSWSYTAIAALALSALLLLGTAVAVALVVAGSRSAQKAKAY
jgi:sensor histidine kinase regulating citrate/malate metabolism